MGMRFRKSFKVAPGVKINLNKKSTSVTFGGKGAHYTINSKGTKTKSVGIPGTGLYYTETSNQKQNSVPPKNPAPPTQHAAPPDNNKKNNRKKKGCLFYLLALLAICICLVFLPLLWIPAIGFIIFFAIKKDTRGTKRRNILVSVAVLIISFIAFVNIDTSDTLTGIQAEWEKTTYDVSETAQVKITPTPSDAKVHSLELSDNNIADLDYSNGKAVITFKQAGEVSLFFTTNGNISSNATTITVTDLAAEQAQKEAEAAAAKKAEEEAQAKAEQAAAEQAAAEQAAAEQAAAEQAAEQAAAEQAAEQAAAEQAQQPQEQMVWIPQTGSKYHSNSSCSGMNNPRQVTISEAQSMGYEPCKKCY